MCIALIFIPQNPSVLKLGFFRAVCAGIYDLVGSLLAIDCAVMACSVCIDAYVRPDKPRSRIQEERSILSWLASGGGTVS